MNKSELIEALAQESNLPLRDADSITNTMLEMEQEVTPSLSWDRGRTIPYF